VTDWSPGGRGNPRDGNWPRFWTRAEDGQGHGREDWRDGWSVDDICPPDPKGDPTPSGRGWREVGLVEGDATWRKAHNKRRTALRLLRRAGYVARYRWPRQVVGKRQIADNLLDDIRYTEGPAEGCQAVDPWEVAQKLRTCGGFWLMQARYRSAPTIEGHFVALPIPALCGQAAVCPVCATLKGRALGRALQAVALDDDLGRDVALVTLTHRASRGESLADALERFRGAWRRMTRGRPGRRFKQVIDAWYYGIEATRGDGASSTSQGPHWHLHAHVLVRIRPYYVDKVRDGDRWIEVVVDNTVADAQRMIGELWVNATRAEAVERDLKRLGWDPLAGMQRFVAEAKPGERQRRLDLLIEAERDGWPMRPRSGRRAWQEPLDATNLRRFRGDWSGPWFQAVDLDADDGVGQLYQAAKYAVKTAELHPVPLAEFISAAHGRRWHQGGGGWRSVVKDAERIPLDELLATDDDGDPRADLGVGVCYLGGRQTPSLDDVLPGIGWAVQPANDATVAEVVDAVESGRTAPGGSPADPKAPLRFRLVDSDEADDLVRLWVGSLRAEVVVEQVEVMKPVRCIDCDGTVVERRLVRFVEDWRWLVVDAERVEQRARATLDELRAVRMAREATGQEARRPSRPGAACTSRQTASPRSPASFPHRRSS